MLNKSTKECHYSALYLFLRCVSVQRGIEVHLKQRKPTTTTRNRGDRTDACSESWQTLVGEVLGVAKQAMQTTIR